MKHSAPLVAALFFICLSFVSPAQNNIDLDSVVRSLESRVTVARTPRDSIYLYSNLYDVAVVRNRQRADSFAGAIYDIATRLGDRSLALEMLRNRANIHMSERDALEGFLTDARIIERSDTALGRETSTFIRICLNTWYDRNATEAQRQERFQEELREWTMTPPEDIYERIVLLHNVCLSLANGNTPTLLGSYLKRLETLISQLPAAQYSLRNTFYVQSALSYYSAGDVKDGMEADRRLLAIMDSMRVDYLQKGRPYHRYDANRFLVYARMLSNYRSLTPEQVEEYYGMAVKYMNQSRRVSDSPVYPALIDTYYYMSHKEFAKAMPLLELLLTKSLTRTQRERVLAMAVEAADSLHNNGRLLELMRDYNAMLTEKLNSRSTEKMREMQILYDVYGMNEKLADMKLDQIEAQNRSQHRIIVISLIFIIGLTIMVIFLVRVYRHARKLSRNLEENNEKLTNESIRLRESQNEVIRERDKVRRGSELASDFVRNLGREITAPLNAVVEYSNLICDCCDTHGKDYLNNYATLVERNGAFIQTLVNDLFTVTETRDGTLPLTRELTDIHSVMQISADTVRPELAEGVTMSIDRDSLHPSVFTDPRRIQQILINLLENAARFTAKGSITMSCALVRERKFVAIAVTDTGIGIDPKYGEKIFERFVKLSESHDDKNHKSPGLGLPIARMMARLLGGDLVLDTTYTSGARFVLTIPNKIKA